MFNTPISHTCLGGCSVFGRVFGRGEDSGGTRLSKKFRDDVWSDDSLWDLPAGPPLPECCDCGLDVMEGGYDLIPDWTDGGFAAICHACHVAPPALHKEPLDAVIDTAITSFKRIADGGQVADDKVDSCRLTQECGCGCWNTGYNGQR